MRNLLKRLVRSLSTAPDESNRDWLGMSNLEFARLVAGVSHHSVSGFGTDPIPSKIPAEFRASYYNFRRRECAAIKQAQRRLDRDPRTRQLLAAIHDKRIHKALGQIYAVWPGTSLNERNNMPDAEKAISLIGPTVESIHFPTCSSTARSGNDSQSQGEERTEYDFYEFTDELMEDAIIKALCIGVSLEMKGGGSSHPQHYMLRLLNKVDLRVYLDQGEIWYQFCSADCDFSDVTQLVQRIEMAIAKGESVVLGVGKGGRASADYIAYR